MIRRTPLAAALAVGLLALTACGTKPAAGEGNTAASSAVSGSPSASPSPTRDFAADAAAAKARHDKAFPDIAARCAAEGAAATAAAPSAAPSATPAAPATPDALPTDPEAAKYAENHAFKKQGRLTPEAKCRGEAHAQRIKQALTGPGVVTPATEESLASALKAMGYELASGEVHRTGGALGFTFFVQGAGPCVTGRLGSPAEVTAHAVYVEGGCTEPRGGH
ncbi:hypothetical protein [Streptomyces xanthophaeus]|uniref:hypothetical protein n=1 Tax=Streptomyces xanthophaeus TaxID=67385 RepID=UPI00233E7056|nr:hypothetical protein [Streptomyces xanthophaeus]